MLKYLYNRVRFKDSHKSKKPIDNTDITEPASNISNNLEKNLNILQDILGNSQDIVVREFTFGQDQEIKTALLFLDGMVDKTTINESIIKPLMYNTHLLRQEQRCDLRNIDVIKSTLLSVGDVKKDSSIGEIISAFLYGDTILLVDGFQEALLIDTKGWPSRAITDPITEQAVRGPRESFVETLRYNTGMLRRKMQNPNFTLESMVIGQRTGTKINLAYIKDIANPQLVEEIKRRLQRIETDAILETGYIEQFIEDAPFSPFATVGNTERPDVIAAKLLEGRVAILVDGSPVVLTVPWLFIEGFQAAEDYYSRPYYASIVRIIRFIAFFISLLAPATYVALATYHQELIPTPLLLTMSAASSGTPFPAVMEAIGMVILFEILREGGIRLPGPVGPALSIVGALVIGDAAISAGLVGAPVVIVVAVTGISSFLVVPYTDAIVILRFLLTILAGILGAFGIIIGMLSILIHLTSLRSFGAPYLSPMTPFSPGGAKDTFIRAPIWSMFSRPSATRSLNRKREAFKLKPQPPEK